MFNTKQLVVVFFLVYSNVTFGKVSCFQSLHGLFFKNQRQLNKARKVVEFNHDSSKYINETEELLTKIRNWSQIGSRGQTIHAMRETGAKLRLKHLMEMSSTNEVVGQLQSYINIPDMAYFTALKHKRHYEAFKHFKNVANFVQIARKEVRVKEILNDEVFDVYVKHFQGQNSLEDVVQAVKQNFGWLDENTVRSEIARLDQMFRNSDLGKKCTVDSNCFLLFTELPKVFSFDFSPFLHIKRPSKLFDALDNEIDQIELRIINQASKLYKHKSEYVAIRKSLQLYFPKELLDDPDKLYSLGRSGSNRMDRLDMIRGMLHSDDAADFDDFKRELVRLRKEFPDTPEVDQFKHLNIDEMTAADETIKENFDRAYFTVKASVVWYKFEPRFHLQKFGSEIGVKIELLKPSKIFEISDQFPASKIRVLRQSLHTEKISAIVTLLPDEGVYRILNKVSDLVTWVPGLRDSKAEIKGFFQALIDEKAILKTYPKVDELAYGPGTLKQKYKTFKEAAAPNSLGDGFVNIFARRADEKAQQTFDKFFKMLEKEIEELKDEAVDIAIYENFKKNHPLVKLFDQMKTGREQLYSKGTLAPWFDNPPNSARYFRLFASGALVGATSYGGYKLVTWLTDVVCESFPGIPDSVCKPLDGELLDRIDNATMDIVTDEAEANGISIENIESNNAADPQ
jgi:hypothetical protein